MMKNKFKTTASVIAVTIVAALLLCLCVSCGATSEDEVIEIHNPADGLPNELEDGYIDISPEMVPLTEFPAMFAAFPTPVASGTDVKKNDNAVIDVSNIKDGYVMVKYLVKTDKLLKILIKGPSTETYQYNMKSDGNYVVCPLSDGNGEYTIKVYENVKGSDYSLKHSAAVNVKLNDEFAPFLRPNQYVNFTENSEVVKKAAELTKDKKTMLDKITAIYDFVINNFTYDKELAATVKSGYLPDVDKILAAKKGICFDYAAVMTAMARSQNIPTKLVLGYASLPTGSVYHAWINTYSEETGWVDSVIYFDGKDWKLMDPTFASTGKQSKETMNLIGDGKTYTVKYLY